MATGIDTSKLDMTSGWNKIINGKLYVWQPDRSAADAAEYHGLEAPSIDETPGVGPGSYVPASADNNGHFPKKLLLGMLAGPAIASGIGGLFGLGGGAAAAGGASTSAATSLPPVVNGLAGAGGAAKAGFSLTKLLPFLDSGMKAIGGAFASSDAKKTRAAELAQQAQLERERLAQGDRESLRSTATAEAGRNPFRDQAQQARTLMMLDAMARARNTPAKLQVPDRYASYVPQMTGGFSYEMDPGVRAAAEGLKKDVAAGHTAPTMTDPNNYGKTGAVDLTSLLARPPASPPPPGGFSAFDDEFGPSSDVTRRRRRPGGVDPWA